MSSRWGGGSKKREKGGRKAVDREFLCQAFASHQWETAGRPQGIHRMAF